MKKFDSLQWIHKYSKNHIFAVVSLSVISALIALAFIGLALISKQVIDIAVGKLKGNIFVYCVFFIGVIAFQAILNVINSNIRVRASGKIEMNIKQGVFNGLVKKELTELNKYHSGEYINRLTSDVGIVVDGVVSIIPQAISMTVKLIAGITVLISIDALFTFILIGCGIIVFFISCLYRKKFKGLHKEVQQTDGKTRSFMQECVENLIVIKSFTSERPITNRLKALQNDNYRAKIKRNKVSNLASTGVYVLFTSGYYLALVWGAIEVSEGKMTFGSLTAFLQVFDQVKAPFRNISGLIPQYFSMIASAERLEELENLKNEVTTKDDVDVAYIYEKMESIKFQNISFTYGEEPIFKEASATFNKGELTAIVGSSGVGKSTLIKLLLGLMTVDSGKIYIEIKDTSCKIDSGYRIDSNYKIDSGYNMDTSYNIDSEYSIDACHKIDSTYNIDESYIIGDDYSIDAGMRKLFSYVPQGNMILSGTIRENITFFNDEIEEQEVMYAAEISCIKEFISELPKGLDTLIGERGIGLSEGQIQRIAIARALTSKAPILLLDEATSALDSVTEKKLLNNLKNLKNKTCIFISHREATIADCDRIIKIENNKILES